MPADVEEIESADREPDRYREQERPGPQIDRRHRGRPALPAERKRDDRRKHQAGDDDEARPRTTRRRLRLTDREAAGRDQHQPRDARQQALVGKQIQPNESWSNVVSGDLLFFGDGEKVTHVGISIGGKDFIHQAGKVAINSLDPNSDVFSPYR